MQGLEPLTDKEILQMRKWLRLANIIIPPLMIERALIELIERRKND